MSSATGSTPWVGASRTLTCDFYSRAPCGIELSLEVCLKLLLALRAPFLCLDCPTVLRISPGRRFLNRALPSNSLAQGLLLAKLEMLRL